MALRRYGSSPSGNKLRATIAMFTAALIGCFRSQMGAVVENSEKPQETACESCAVKETDEPRRKSMLKLIDELASRNAAPILTDRFFPIVFSEDFRWEDQSRVKTAWKDVFLRADDEFGAVKRGCSDARYSVSYYVDEPRNAVNMTVGDICWSIFLRRVTGFIDSANPVQRQIPNRLFFPLAMTKDERMEWLRRHEGLSLSQLQLWALDQVSRNLAETTDYSAAEKSIAFARVHEMVRLIKSTSKPIATGYGSKSTDVPMGPWNEERIFFFTQSSAASDGRFGPGFYVHQEGASELAVAADGVESVIDMSRLKVLDLTQNGIAEEWSYTDGTERAVSRSIGAIVRGTETNAIRFKPIDDSGINLALVTDENVLSRKRRILQSK